MTPNLKIDIESFLYDIVVLEAKRMMQELKNEFLHVILIDAPEQKHTGHKIRAADNRNPKWYRELYSSYPSLKRNHTIKTLKRIENKKIDLSFVYDQLLLRLILNRIGVDEFSLESNY